MNESDPMLNKIRHRLDNQPVDAATRARLAGARQQALTQQTPVWSRRYAAPALAFASLSGLALVLTLTLFRPAAVNDDDAATAFEIVTSNDPMEMYEELEFYLWLEDAMNNEERA